MLVTDTACNYQAELNEQSPNWVQLNVRYMVNQFGNVEGKYMFMSNVASSLLGFWS